MRYDLILKNGILVSPAENINADIAVINGKIASVGINSGDTADEIYDASGKHILSGIIDAHVHFRDPGLTEKEDFQTGSEAAAFGGITMIADMPNTLPVTSTAERFREKASIAKEKSCIDFGLYALLTEDNTLEMESLKEAGAFGFKIFLGASTGDIAAPEEKTMFAQMEKSSRLGLRIGFHAETNALNSYFTSLTAEKKQGNAGVLLSESRPVISEALAIQTAICYARYAGAKIHIHHVTSLDGCQLVAEAKQKGIKVTAETCPHYLLFGAETSARKVYPPIRGEKHRAFLWDALKSGTIDMIASDHAPHTDREKSLSVWDAPAGLSGVETFVPLMLNEVNNGRLSLNDFVRAASEAPAKIWGVYPRKGSLLPGADADFTVVDMETRKTIKAGELHGKGKTSPYDGMEPRGFPVATIVRGKFIVRDGQFCGNRGYGELISPAP